MNLVTVVWMLWMLAGVAIEVWALSDHVPGNTLSEIIWNVTKSYPLVPLLFGILTGHFFWQRPAVQAAIRTLIHH